MGAAEGRHHIDNARWPAFIASPRSAFVHQDEPSFVTNIPEQVARQQSGFESSVPAYAAFCSDDLTSPPTRDLPLAATVTKSG